MHAHDVIPTWCASYHEPKKAHETFSLLISCTWYALAMQRGLFAIRYSLGYTAPILARKHFPYPVYSGRNTPPFWCIPIPTAKKLSFKNAVPPLHIAGLLLTSRFLACNKVMRKCLARVMPSSKKRTIKTDISQLYPRLHRFWRRGEP
jgi:hypothetical protein